MTAPDFLSKLSISSRSEITVGSNSPPYLSLASPPRKSLALSSAPSTPLMLSSAVEMMLVIFSPLLESEAVNVSKFRSVSFTATSLSVITLSTLRSATRIFSWVLSVPSGSAVSSGMPSAPFRGGGASSEPPVKEIAAMPVSPWNSRPTCVSLFTGVLPSIIASATTRRGWSSFSDTTSPTRMPAKFTLPPWRRPEAEPSKITRNGTCCLMPASF